jgi:hypothetical protein
MKKKFTVRKTDGGNLVIEHKGNQEAFTHSLQSIFEELQRNHRKNLE